MSRLISTRPRMAEPIRAVYLSPHQDDVCFSLGELATKLRDGALINIFSISDYTDEALQLPSEPHLVSQIRDQEDDEFALWCGLKKYNLKQLDSPLRGWDPFDTNDLSDEVDQISQVLINLLATMTHTDARSLLFCPAGIGMHRDHLITRDAIVRNYEELQKGFDILFYEDLHYASDAEDREQGLEAFFVAVENLGYAKRYRFSVTSEKLALVSRYKSQFDRLPEDLSTFTPADGTNVPHEALWANTRIDILDQLSDPSCPRRQQ